MFIIHGMSHKVVIPYFYFCTDYSCTDYPYDFEPFAGSGNMSCWRMSRYYTHLCRPEYDVSQHCCYSCSTVCE